MADSFLTNHTFLNAKCDWGLCLLPRMLIGWGQIAHTPRWAGGQITEKRFSWFFSLNWAKEPQQIIVILKRKSEIICWLCKNNVLIINIYLLVCIQMTLGSNECSYFWVLCGKWAILGSLKCNFSAKFWSGYLFIYLVAEVHHDFCFHCSTQKRAIHWKTARTIWSFSFTIYYFVWWFNCNYILMWH